MEFKKAGAKKGSAAMKIRSKYVPDWDDDEEAKLRIGVANTLKLHPMPGRGQILTPKLRTIGSKQFIVVSF